MQKSHECCRQVTSQDCSATQHKVSFNVADRKVLKVVTQQLAVGALSPVNHKGLHQGCSNTTQSLINVADRNMLKMVTQQLVS